MWMLWKFTGDRPVYQQIMEHIRGAILVGAYPPGGRIPPVRDLAAEAKVNPNTMQRALTELERKGLLVGGGTSGRTVTMDEEILASMRNDMLNKVARECAAKFMLLGVSPSQAACLLLELEEEKEE
jgi:DNA-binding transcriptional regulator YhcF (GntR family)